MSTFVLRLGVQRQDLFVPDAFSLLERRVSKTFNLERLERLSKIEFLEEFIGVLSKAPNRKGPPFFSSFPGSSPFVLKLFGWLSGASH
jgi:hypothetical protein